MSDERGANLIPRGKVPPIPGIRRLWKVLLRARFLLFHRRRYDRLVLEEVEGLPLLVLPGVFNPGLLLTGEFMVRELGGERIPRGAGVLDLGCGTGIGAVIAAPAAAHVVATDVNPAALRNTRLNASLHDFEEKIEVLESDLFAGLAGRRFDTILFNPPFYVGTPENDLDRAWRAEGLFERFAAELPEHLSPEGSAWVVFSTEGDLDGLLAAFRAHGLRVELAVEHDVVHEILVLYRVRPALAGGEVPGFPVVVAAVFRRCRERCHQSPEVSGR